jgi:hypothetical protein
MEADYIQIDDALWQAAKARQDSISVKYAATIEATRTANCLKRTR